MAMSVTAACENHWKCTYGAITEEQTTTSATEVTLGTITIPGDSMGPTGCVMIAVDWRADGGTASKTMRVKFDGTVIKEAVGTGNSWGVDMAHIYVWNKNDTSAQGASFKHSWVHSRIGEPARNLTADTTSDVDVTFTGFAASSNTVHLRFAFVKVYQLVRPL